MPASLNSVHLIGNIGSDIDLRSMPSGDPVADFRLAMNTHTIKKDGVREDHVEWITVVVFGNNAKVCHENLRKGSMVFIDGRLMTDEFTSKEGTRVRKTKVVVRSIQFLSKYGPIEKDDK